MGNFYDFEHPENMGNYTELDFRINDIMREGANQGVNTCETIQLPQRLQDMLRPIFAEVVDTVRLIKNNGEAYLIFQTGVCHDGTPITNMFHIRDNVLEKFLKRRITEYVSNLPRNENGMLEARPNVDVKAVMDELEFGGKYNRPEVLFLSKSGSSKRNSSI